MCSEVIIGRKHRTNGIWSYGTIIIIIIIIKPHAQGGTLTLIQSAGINQPKLKYVTSTKSNEQVVFAVERRGKRNKILLTH